MDQRKTGGIWVLGSGMMEDNTLLQEIGGRPVLEKVHKLFYDKLYEHPWLKIFFLHIDQKVIENQQTDFMVSNMGGGKIYSGGLPRTVHRHMYITEELFDLRTEILKESILACGVPGALAERWVRIDGAFKHSLVKKSIDDCEKRFFTDEILSFPKPS
jgi:truncated hemoglobin YjbI